jgi:CBS domain containing-hemolysin-like protein
LDLREKRVSAIMTPIEDVFTLRADEILSQEVENEVLNIFFRFYILISFFVTCNMLKYTIRFFLLKILTKGYSRIPVYEPPNKNNFIGMLLVKKLITHRPKDILMVKDFPLSPLPETGPFTSCLEILKYFQEGRSKILSVFFFVMFRY